MRRQSSTTVTGQVPPAAVTVTGAARRAAHCADALSGPASTTARPGDPATVMVDMACSHEGSSPLATLWSGSSRTPGASSPPHLSTARAGALADTPSVGGMMLISICEHTVSRNLTCSAPMSSAELTVSGVSRIGASPLLARSTAR